MTIELLRKVKRTRALDPSPDLRRLADGFRAVKTLNDCVDTLLKHGMLPTNGLTIQSYGSIEQICTLLRADGMAMEPNLLGRAAVSLASGLRAAGTAAKQFAPKDTDFLRFANLGDKSRDAGNYDQAQYNYWRALQLYPAHPAYQLQYAHCLKERGLPEDALVSYLDAFYYGASLVEIERHAVHTASTCGLLDQVMGTLKENAASLALPDSNSISQLMTSRDVKAAVRLFHLEEPSISRVARYMSECRNRKLLLLKLITESQFQTAHRDLLTLLKETRSIER